MLDLYSDFRDWAFESWWQAIIGGLTIAASLWILMYLWLGLAALGRSFGKGFGQGWHKDDQSQHDDQGPTSRDDTPS